MTRRSSDKRLDGLLRTACDVIARQGVANTRTADVARAAGVSQALVFYHFDSKERLLASAFAYAAEQDTARLDAVLRSPARPPEKLRKLIRQYAPGGPARLWPMWIDGWSESLRVPEVERVSRGLDLRWRQAIEDVIGEGMADGSFKCDDPTGAAWRINALLDGLAVQITVHERVVSRRQALEWACLAAAREVGLEPAELI